MLHNPLRLTDSKKTAVWRGMVHHVIYVTQAEAHGETGSLLGPVGTNPPFRRPANPGVTTLSRLPLAQTGLSPPSKAWNSVEASVLKRHSGPWM